MNLTFDRLYDFVKYIYKSTMYYNYICVREYAREAKQLSEGLMYPVSIDNLIGIIKASKRFRTNQRPFEIHQLLSLLADLDATNILEIGTEKGGTLFLFCQVCNPKANIISMDFRYPSIAHIKSMEYLCRKEQKMSCIEGDSHIEASYQKVKSVLQNNLLDFLFIDGDHSYEGVKNDFYRYSPLVRSGGIIAIHDIYPDYSLRYGRKTLNKVGQVPIFWQEIKAQFPNAKEFIEDFNQDGFGIGLLVKP